MTNGKIGVGIAGLGLIARSHAVGYQRIADQVEIRAVCDVDPDRAASFAAEFGGKPQTELRALLDNPSIDAIDLILPHHRHVEAATAVLEAGKHLLIEKPLAPTYAESVALLEKAVRAGVRLMVAENTRYVAGYMAAAQLLDQGAIGNVNRVRTFLSSNEKFRLSQPNFWGRRFETGGGLILDTGAHSFYLIKWLLGEFGKLAAFTSQVFPADCEIEDTAEVVGTLASGAAFSCGMSAVSEIPHSERLELYGTDGGIVVDQMADPVVKLFRGMMDFGGERVPDVPYGPNGWNPGGWHYESVIREVQDFVCALVEDRPTFIDSGDCAYAIRIVEASYEAARSGRTVSI